MRVVMCLLIFIILTVEDARIFGQGHFHTVMAKMWPLFLGNPLKPWDVAVILAGLPALLRPRTWREKVGPMSLALISCAGGIFLLVVWGLFRGGDARMAYFQLAGLLRLLLLYPLIWATFRTSRDHRLLVGTVIAAATFRAVTSVRAHSFFLANLGTIPWPEYMTDHDDSALWTIVVIGLVAWLLVRFRPHTLALVVPLLVLLLAGIHYNDRRIAWVELVGGLVMVWLVMPRGRLRRRLNRAALLAAPVVLLYIAVGWGRGGAMFAPVREIRSLFTSSGDNSNTYRDAENAGLVVTLQQTRLVGTGFGHPFVEISGAYSSGMANIWSEYRFIPHNSVLFLAAAGGILGFPAVWVVLPVGAFLAARARAAAKRPLDQALASTTFAFPFVYGVQAFGDMGLQSWSVNALLACSLALASRLAVTTGAWPVRRRGRRPSPGRVQPGQHPADVEPSVAGARP